MILTLNKSILNLNYNNNNGKLLNYILKPLKYIS